jgi:ABC-type proline/glycine betaine transport system ATPase subunit
MSEETIKENSTGCDPGPKVRFPSDGQTTIEFRSVGFALPNGRTPLADLNLAVNSGRPGAAPQRLGKTTTMKLINRLLTRLPARSASRANRRWSGPDGCAAASAHVIQEIGLFRI